jgi:hypothetical protein
MYPRVLYAVIFGWSSWTGGRFTAPFLEDECHFSETQVGVALAVQNLLMSLLAAPCGRLADKLQIKYNHGRIYVLQAGLLLASAAFLLHGLPRLWYLPMQKSEIAVLVSWGFEYHLALRIVYAVGLAMVLPVMDGITLAHLKAEGIDRSSYGRERLFGAVSWMIAHGLLGPVLDWFGFKALYMTATAAVLLSSCLIYKYTRDLDKHAIHLTAYLEFEDDTGLDDQTTLLPGYTQNNANSYQAIPTTLDPDNLTDDREEASKPLDSQSTTSKSRDGSTLPWILGIMSGNVFGIGFIICFFTLSMGTSVVEQLIFLFFGFLGSSNTMCGLTVFVTVMFEIPLFHYAPVLLDKFGPSTLLYVACFAFVTRVFGYTLIPGQQPYWVLLLEPLHGVTYACSKTSSVEFVAELVPIGHEAAGQGLMFLVRGLGSFCGILLGGTVEDYYGPRTMYRSLGLIVGTGVLIYAMADVHHRLAVRTTQSPSR